MIDEELVRRASHNQMEAFDELVERYMNKVYTLAFFCMGSKEEALNMTQITMVKLHRSLKQYKGEQAFDLWLYRIAVSVCLEELFQQKPGGFSRLVDRSKKVETEQDNLPRGSGETLEEVQVILSHMEPEVRVVVVFKDIMNLSFEDVAFVLQSSVGSVKSRLNRGRTIIRNRWNSMAPLVTEGESDS